LRLSHTDLHPFIALCSLSITLAPDEGFGVQPSHFSKAQSRFFLKERGRKNKEKCSVDVKSSQKPNDSRSQAPAEPAKLTASVLAASDEEYRPARLVSR
jgi:hypothetical protein